MRSSPMPSQQRPLVAKKGDDPPVTPGVNRANAIAPVGNIKGPFGATLRAVRARTETGLPTTVDGPEHEFSPSRKSRILLLPRENKARNAHDALKLRSRCASAAKPTNSRPPPKNTARNAQVAGCRLNLGAALAASGRVVTAAAIRTARRVSHRRKNASATRVGFFAKGTESKTTRRSVSCPRTECVNL